MDKHTADLYVSKAEVYGTNLLVVGTDVPDTLKKALTESSMEVRYFPHLELSTIIYPHLREHVLWAHTVINLQHNEVQCKSDEIFNILSVVEIENYWPYETVKNHKWWDFSLTRLANQYEINEVIDDIRVCFPELNYHYRHRIGIVFAGAASDTAISHLTVNKLITEVNSLIDKGCDRFLFCNLQETVQLSSILKTQLVATAMRDKLHHSQFVYATAAMHAQREWPVFCRENNITNPINIISANIYDRPWGEQQNIPPYDISKMPEKLFLSYNNTIRWHRTQLAVMLEKEGLLEKGFVSLRTEGPHNFELGLGPEYQPAINKLNAKRCIVLDDVDQRSAHIAFPDEKDIYYHQNSHFSLVTETIFQNDPKPQKHGETEYLRNLIFYTEKTYKPIWFFQPFIVCAVPGFLAAMRDLGWQTFHPWINEEYDNIQDDEKRLEAIVQEVKRLSKFSEPEWREFRRNVHDAVMENGMRIRRGAGEPLASSEYLKFFN